MFDINSPDIQAYLESGKIEAEYPANCLPNKLQSPTTKKSRKCFFEKLNMNLYEEGARMVGFRTTANRILPWLKSLGAFYFEYVGKQPEMQVTWVDNPEKVSPTEPLKNITIDVSSGEIKLYKITVHISTGFIQVQGNKYDTIFADKDFPILLHIVHSLKGPIESRDEIKPEHEGQDEEFSDSDETCLLKIDSSNETNDTNNNPTKSNNKGSISKETSTTVTGPNDDLKRIEATLTNTIDKISQYQQSVENDLLKKIDDIRDIIKSVQKMKINDDSNASSDIQILKNKVAQLESEKQTLQAQLQNERSMAALSNANNEAAIKHEKVLVSSLRDELISVTASATKEIDFTSGQMEKKNNEILELRQQIKDLSENVSSLQDQNLSLKAQVANMYDEQVMKSKAPKDQQKSDTKIAVLIGTSNVKNIDEKRLTNAIDVSKIISYTILQAKQAISNLTVTPEIIILHILTNDIKTKDPKTCVSELQKLVNDIFTEWNDITVIISLTTPRTDDVSYYTNGQIVNAMIRQVYSQHGKVHLVDHSNMCLDGAPNSDCLDTDGFHLNEKGTTFLAANIKRSIHGVLGLPMPTSYRNRSRSRGRRGRGRGGRGRN